MICNKCGHPLTASATTNRNKKRYYYYECKYCGKKSHPLEDVHKSFLKFLSRFQVSQNILNLYEATMMEMVKENNQNEVREIQKIEKQIKELQNEIEVANELLLKREISSEDRNGMVGLRKEKITKLEQEKSNLMSIEDEYEKYFKKGIHILGDLVKYFEISDFELKNKILGSIFPENFEFNGSNFRTKRINEVVKLICNNYKDLEEYKNDKAAQKSSRSSLVPTT